MPDTRRQDIIGAYYRMRQTLGYLGLVLPVLLVAGGLAAESRVESALSDYYHTLLRDVFVGAMAAIGVFLICYTGYRRDGEERLSDDWITTIAGAAALVVALFPNIERRAGAAGAVESLPQMAFGSMASGLVHHVAAMTFLLCLAYLCLVKFTRTAQPVRARIYRACGWTIVAATLATVVVAWLRALGTPPQQAFVTRYLLVLVFESIGVWAFSLSWLTKGHADATILRALHLRKRQASAPDPD